MKPLPRYVRPALILTGALGVGIVITALMGVDMIAREHPSYPRIPLRPPAAKSKGGWNHLDTNTTPAWSSYRSKRGDEVWVAS